MRSHTQRERAKESDRLNEWKNKRTQKGWKRWWETHDCLARKGGGERSHRSIAPLWVLDRSYKSTNTLTWINKNALPIKWLKVWGSPKCLLNQGLHSPPLAYSMIRYKVFSVSITSNKWTVTHSKRDIKTKTTQIMKKSTNTGTHSMHIHKNPSLHVTHLCWDGWVFSWSVPLGITGKCRRRRKEKLSSKKIEGICTELKKYVPKHNNRTK